MRYFGDPLEAVLGLFVMSFGEFIDVYEAFDDTVSKTTCQVKTWGRTHADVTYSLLHLPVRQLITSIRNCGMLPM